MKNKRKKSRQKIVLIAIIILIIIAILGKERNEKKILPEISLNGQETIELTQDEKYEEQGAKAHKKNKDLSENIITDGEVNTSKPGTYTVKYKITDEEGKTQEVTRTVIVKEKEETEVINELIDKQGKLGSLPVLMYHFFYNAKAGESGKDANWTEVSDFENQMKYLSDNEFYFPSWEAVEKYVKGEESLPTKSVVVTIDDGDESFIKYAIPIIEKYNVKATSFVVTSWNGDWLPNQYKSDHLDFQSHSHDMHRAGANGKGRFVNLSYEEALKDVTTSRDIIGDATVFCYPFGHYNDTAKKVLKEAGYKLSFTTNGGRVKPNMDEYELPRVRISKGISLNSFMEKVK